MKQYHIYFADVTCVLQIIIYQFHCSVRSLALVFGRRTCSIWFINIIQNSSKYNCFMLYNAM